MKIMLVSLFLVGSIVATEVKIPISFSSKFTQKITNPKNKIIKYSGSMLLNSNGGLKWNYKQPTKKEICSTNKDFMIVDHDLEQVSFYTLRKSLDLIAILKSAKHHKANLYVASYQDRNYTFSIDSKGRIDQIAYRDELDNVVNIRFKNMHYRNILNSKSKMKCTYPSSYDIIQG